MNTLAFHTKLESNVLHLFNIENLLGKEVIITIVEIPSIDSKANRIWNYLGAMHLNNAYDKLNLRDLAYD